MKYKAEELNEAQRYFDSILDIIMDLTAERDHLKDKIGELEGEIDLLGVQLAKAEAGGFKRD